MNKFKVRDENGIEREATIITKIEENQVNYLVYTIDRDAQTSNIFVSKLINGNLEDIQNPEEKQKVNELVKHIIKLGAE